MTRTRAHHLYVADPTVPADHRGNGRCTCGLALANDVHDLPAHDPDQADAERRRLGERDDRGAA